MEWINWIYVALGAGGWIIGFLIGNAMRKATVDNLMKMAFKEGVLTGVEIAKAALETETVEEEITR